MQKPLGIQKCDGRMDRPTDLPTDRPTDRPTDTARCRVTCPRLKTYSFSAFFVAAPRLSTLPCRSVGRSVGQSIRPSHF